MKVAVGEDVAVDLVAKFTRELEKQITARWIRDPTCKVS
jgi:hypothetical protein